MTIQLFKWMMALAIMIYLPLLFEQMKGFRRIDRKHSDEYLKERTESIYFDVTHFYNRLGTMRQEGFAEPEQWPDFDGQYCSKAWNDLVAVVQQEEERHGDSATRFFSRNYWIGGQELDFLYINKVEVIDRTGEQATVSLTLHNGDHAVPVLLCLVFENDDWRIDNMTYYWNVKPADNYFDWRQQMEQYAE